MKLISVGLLLFAGSLLASPLEWTTVRGDLDKEVTHHVEEVRTPLKIVEYIDLELEREPVPTEPGLGSQVDIDQIINLGQKLWKIITDNKPTLTATHTYANALPAGVKGSDELEGFSRAQFRSFRMYGTNVFGSTVYDLTYTAVHRYGGSYNGRGRYLDSVTVLPHKIDVSWGYNVNFSVEKISTVNVGTKESPIASLLMQMTFRVSTPFKVTERRALFDFRGDTSEVASLQ